MPIKVERIEQLQPGTRVQWNYPSSVGCTIWYGTVKTILNNRYALILWDNGRVSDAFRVFGDTPLFLEDSPPQPTSLSKFINKIYEREKKKGTA